MYHVYFTSGFQVALMAKNPRVNAGDARDAASTPALGGSPGVGSGDPLQGPCLESPMGRRAWRATVRGATESDLTEHTRSFTLNVLKRRKHMRRKRSAKVSAILFPLAV